MKKIFTFLFLLIVINFTYSQSIIWSDTFGGSNADNYNKIINTSDGGYAAIGFTLSTNGDITNSYGAHELIIVKYDNDGTRQWSKILGGSQTERGYSLAQSADGGYILAGSTASTDSGDIPTSHGGTDAWLVKLDANGNKEWSKTYGGTGSEYFKDVLVTTDGKYIAAGYSGSNNGDITNPKGGNDVWVVKVDTNGTIEWSKNIGGSAAEEANKIINSSDGGTLIAGFTKSPDGDVGGTKGGDDYFLIKLDASGNLTWTKTYGGAEMDRALGVLESQDGGYIVSGLSESLDGDVGENNGDYDTWLIKTTASGEIEWSKVYGGIALDYLYTIQQLTNGDYLLAGQTLSSLDSFTNYGNADAWLININPTGELNWSKNFGGTKEDIVSDFVLSDNEQSLVFAGYSESSDFDLSQNAGNDDAWIFKVKNINLVVTGDNQIEVGDTKQLTTAIYPSDLNSSILWSVVIGSEYLSVDSNGLVSGLTPGESVVRAALADHPDLHYDFNIEVLEVGGCNQIFDEPLSAVYPISDTDPSGLMLANDFKVAEGIKFSPNQIDFEFISADGTLPKTISFDIVKDSNEAPGEVIASYNSINFDSVVEFGIYQEVLPIHKSSIILPEPFELTEGTYWIVLKNAFSENNTMLYATISIFNPANNDTFFTVGSTNQGAAWQTLTGNEGIFKISGICNDVITLDITTENGVSPQVVVDDTLQLEAHLTPEDTNEEIVWSITEGNNLASVDQNGLVTGITYGFVTVRASLQSDSEIFDEIEIEILSIDHCGQDFDGEVENAYLATLDPQFVGDVVKVANDFVIQDSINFELQQIAFKFFMTNSNPPEFVSFYIANDNNGVPGEQIQNYENHPFVLTEKVGELNSLPIFSAKLLLNEPLNLTTGKYWIVVSDIVNQSGAPSYWAAHQKDSTNDTSFALIKVGDQAWQAGTGYEGNFAIYGVCKDNLAVTDLKGAKVNYYPNPIIDKFTINSEDKINSVEIYNIAGQRLKVININGVNTTQVNCKDLIAGNYLFKINTSTGTQTVKVIKK